MGKFGQRCPEANGEANARVEGMVWQQAAGESWMKAGRFEVGVGRGGRERGGEVRSRG